MIEKSAYEEIFFCLQFLRSDGNGALNSDEVLSGTPTVKVYDSDGSDVSTAMAPSAFVSVYSSTQVKFKLAGGTAGEMYDIVIKAQTSNGQKFEDNSWMNPELKIHILPSYA